MMGSLAALAGLEVRALVQRHLRVGALALAAIVFALAAVAYALSALALVLAAAYGAINANLMIGAGLLLCAALVTLAAWWVRRQPKSDQTRAAMALAAAPLAASVGRSLAPNLLKAAPLMLIVGLIVGRVFNSRE